MLLLTDIRTSNTSTAIIFHGLPIGVLVIAAGVVVESFVLVDRQQTCCSTD